MKPLFLLLLVSSLLLVSGCCTPRQTHSSAPKLTILKAVYGIGNQTIEVTDAVNSLVDGDTIRLAPTWSLGPVDPAVGRVKTVTIAYQHKGRLQLASFTQAQEIVLPPPR